MQCLRKLLKRIIAFFFNDRKQENEKLTLRVFLAEFMTCKKFSKMIDDIENGFPVTYQNRYIVTVVREINLELKKDRPNVKAINFDKDYLLSRLSKKGVEKGFETKMLATS